MLRLVHKYQSCRTFLDSRARIRSGDTMIFSQIQKPIGMRKTRVGKRIYVHRAPLDTSWFCPCCATVDTAFVTLRGAENRARISVGLTRLLDHFDASARLGGGSVRSHKETCVGCIVSLTTPTRSSLKASRSVSSLSLDENASSVCLASYLRL